jgi:hypothetical protein
MRRSRFVLAPITLLAGMTFAKWMVITHEVPVERVIANVEKDLRANPRDAELHFRLGRLHSLGFANSTTAKGFRDIPGVYVSLDDQPKKLSKSRANHLNKSIKEYEEAIRLDNKRALYYVGLGWVCEAGIPYAGQVTLSGGKRPTQADLRARALAAFRKAFRIDIKKDQMTKSDLEGPTSHLSREAASHIKSLLGKSISKTEKAMLDREVAKIPRPTAVTPIIIPLSGAQSLADCLSPTARVHFDLLGDGLPRTWPWVQPTTGILVWDPLGKGKITSGIQLFGSSTFWVFFADGYQALRSLDDNRDGWLRGRELLGIAIWRDLDQDGVSDKGEVLPVRSLGIAGLSTRPSGQTMGMLTADRGVLWADGHISPSYDWVATSLPVRP